MSRQEVRTKVVVRLLPPTLTEDAFLELIGEWVGATDWVSYWKGKTSTHVLNHSRAYLNFKHPADVFRFKASFDGHAFVSERGAQYKCSVEFAPNQRVARGKGLRDPREGSFEKDEDYNAFLAKLQVGKTPLPSAEALLKARETNGTAAGSKGPMETALMQYLKQKREKKEKRAERGTRKKGPPAGAPGAASTARQQLQRQKDKEKGSKNKASTSVDTEVTVDKSKGKRDKNKGKGKQQPPAEGPEEVRSGGPSVKPGKEKEKPPKIKEALPPPKKKLVPVPISRRGGAGEQPAAAAGPGGLLRTSAPKILQRKPQSGPQNSEVSDPPSTILITKDSRGTAGSGAPSDSGAGTSCIKPPPGLPPPAPKGHRDRGGVQVQASSTAEGAPERSQHGPHPPRGGAGRVTRGGRGGQGRAGRRGGGGGRGDRNSTDAGAAPPPPVVVVKRPKAKNASDEANG